MTLRAQGILGRPSRRLAVALFGCAVVATCSLAQGDEDDLTPSPSPDMELQVPAPSAPPSPLQRPAERAVSDQAGMDFLQSIERRNRWLEAVSGRFIQIRSSPLFAVDMVTTGHFVCTRYPYRMRCDLRTRGLRSDETPTTCVVWSDAEQTHALAAGLGTADDFPARVAGNQLKRLNFLAFGFFARTAEVANLYAVQKDAQNPNRLRFIPYFPPELGGVTLLTVDFDGRSLYPTRVFIAEENGDATLMMLRNTLVNVPASRELDDQLTPYRQTRRVALGGDPGTTP